MNIMDKINKLPEDMVQCIKEFIPNKELVLTNKTYYNQYHHLLKRKIPMYESYIRDIIRRDNYFVFQRILNENIHKWMLNKPYAYKNMIFNNYIYFVIHYCIENNSENCRKILMEYLAEQDLCRNLHKKKVVKYIKWNN